MKEQSLEYFSSLEVRVKEKVVGQELFCGGFVVMDGTASSGT